MPALSSDLAWKIYTMAAGSPWHFGEVEGYRLSRQFVRSSILLEDQRLVGGVGDGLEARTPSTG